jgi:DNA-binding NarL/FixJ family response regulator
MASLSSIIADDHPLFRMALQQAIAEVIGDEVRFTEDFEQTIKALSKQENTDLLFLDLKMPGNDGLTGLMNIISSFPNLSVIIVSAEESVQVIHKVMEMGACAFIPKSSSLDKMAEAVEHVLNGEFWVPDYINLDAIENSDTQNADIKENLSRLAQLTPNQLKVLKMMADGLLNKQIAYELNISESTVKQHSSQVLKKLGLNNRTQAGVIYKQLMFIEN